MPDGDQKIHGIASAGWRDWEAPSERVWSSGYGVFREIIDGGERLTGTERPLSHHEILGIRPYWFACRFPSIPATLGCVGGLEQGL